jgi:tetratricopeptide (TPR) repeat protein
VLAISLTIAVASSWAAPCKLRHTEMPVRIVEGRPIATLKLNGTEMPMLVDSGAFYSFLSASTATQLNLRLRNAPPNLRIEGYAGRVMDVRLARVDSVGLLGAELPNVDFLVGGNELNAGIMGVLGRNFLSAADTEYDLAHGMVRLSSPEGDCDKTSFAYWAGGAPVIELPLEPPRSPQDSAIRVQVSINGSKAVALLDTGAPQTAMTLAAARRAGIKEADLKLIGRSGGAGQGRVKTWLGPVALFEVGGEKIENNRLRIDDNDVASQDVLIGLDYFLSHRIYVSRLQRKVYITWNGGPVFARNRTTADTADSKFAAVPNEVAKDDADALARRGAAALAAGNHARALEDLNRACELAPGVASYFFDRARVHTAMRQPRLALADLDEALRLDPALAPARLRRALVREFMGRDRAGALADLAQLDATLPPASNLRLEVADLYGRMAQVPEALKQFDLWIGSHPHDARLAAALHSRCWMRTRLNLELQLALKDCKDAVDEDAGSALHRGGLGWTYLRLGDATKAKAAFDEAIRLSELPMALYGRGLAQLRLNEKAAGERDLAAARKANPRIDAEAQKEGFEFAEAAARPASAGS